MIQIESLLSARLLVAPQVVGERIYVISNLSGRLSLNALDYGGSVPEPLLPPHIALQNPALIGGQSFYVFPALGQILVMIDHDGDENYQPMRVPLDGGLPEPAFGDRFARSRVYLLHAERESGTAYLVAESRDVQVYEAYKAELATGALTKLGGSRWGGFIDGVSADETCVVMIDGYTVGDHVLYLWRQGHEGRELLCGTPLEERTAGEPVRPTSIFNCQFTRDNRGLVFATGLFEDNYGLGYLALDDPSAVRPVTVAGTVHTGTGELTHLERLRDARYRVDYNSDGCSWIYEGRFDEEALRMTLDRVVVGTGALANGVVNSISYDRIGDRYALSFSTATTPTEIYTVEGPDRSTVVRHTRERILGIPSELLSPGEDASFTSFDSLRVSARLYLPAPALGYAGPRPLIYYIHGGPQGQERPDFAWFSMPLIQFLTLNGCAVFVPNVRGSTGYGLSYTKRVDRDWGGQDRLDHVHAMTEVLPRDERLDTTRAGVVGRSYGGYMTLTLAARHPALWSAAVDMFGPYDLHTFMERVPETWKPYLAMAVGDPVKDHAFLVERSPSTYIDEIQCPLLVIQGRNDPRVIERESREVVERLRASGKSVEYLVFDDEGHDVLKFENRVRCYNAITRFFTEHLQP